MPQSNLFPKNGSVVLGSFVADFNSFEQELEQSVEDATAYSTTTLMGKNVGSGTPTSMLRVGAFALKGATGTKLGTDGSLFTAGQMLTTTLTWDTGCTTAGPWILQRQRIQHARMRATVPILMELKNGGDQTETYAVS